MSSLTIILAFTLAHLLISLIFGPRGLRLQIKYHWTKLFWRTAIIYLTLMLAQWLLLRTSPEAFYLIWAVALFLHIVSIKLTHRLNPTLCAMYEPLTKRQVTIESISEAKEPTY